MSQPPVDNPPLPTGQQPARDRALAECPIFAPIERASIAFAVEIAQTAQPSAFRISQVYRSIFGPGQRLTGDDRGRTQTLFASSRSFLDDITTGDPGVNGRPLVLAAEADADGPMRHALTLERPPVWDYEFEGLRVGLEVAAARRRLPLAFHEHLCVFESGRILYVVVLGDHPDEGPRLDEYALIQLQQLVVEPQRTAHAGYLGFRQAPESAPVSFAEFVSGRLALLSSATQAQGPHASALRDVLARFGILEGPLKLAVVAEHLAIENAIVMIEDTAVFEAAGHAYQFYRMDGEGENAWTSAQPAKWSDRDSRWRAQIDAARSHTIEGFGYEPDERPIPRPLKAFAGIAQAVPDFPRVDESELHDSTRPISIAPQNLFYNHPDVQLEVGIQWRTFREAQAAIGACPYALLTWLIAVHDELIVSDMEARIERMLLGEVDERTQLARIGPTRPMRGVDEVMKRMRDPWPSTGRLVDKDLEARIDIFRWCSIHRAGNVFRYSTERELLANITAARGTGERFENAHQMLDRYENLIEDVSALAGSYASRNTNFLLGAITAFGVLQLVPLVDQMDEMGTGTAIGRLLLIALVLLLLFAAWRWIDQLRR